MTQILTLTEPVLVFGSNLAGRHGAGAARDAAAYYGARYGEGVGAHGRSYAIPTKDRAIRTLPLDTIRPYVAEFLEYARSRPDRTFLITPIGTGLAGYSASVIAPMFRGAPNNCMLPGSWLQVLGIPETRLVVAGSRSFGNGSQLYEACDRFKSGLSGLMKLSVVSGTAAGADRMGEAWATDRGVDIVRIPAEWDRLEKAAGFARNKLMACYGTHLLAFWDGKSPGTRHMLDTARSFGLPIVGDTPALPAIGINIFSGEGGLGSVLTNPTELAREKGLLQRQYPVQFMGKLWPDAEAAYQHLKLGNPLEDDRLMAEIIAAKFRQHPRILDAINEKGGAAFIAACSHVTGARTASAKAWEGKGVESRFIRNLLAGYELVNSGAEGLATGEQASLF